MEFEALREATQQALRFWARDSRAGNPLEPLRLFQHYQRNATSTRNASNKLLQDALAELKTMHPKEAALLHERFMVGINVVDAAKQRHVATSTLYNWQRSALTHLAEIIAGREAQLRAASTRASLYPMRPVVSAYLVGLEERAAPLLPLLRRSDAPWLICLSGMGGLGKTTLANYLARTLVDYGEFADVVWVSAQTQRLVPDGTLHEVIHPIRTPRGCIHALAKQVTAPSHLPPERPADAASALLHRLKETAHLVVVDRVDLVKDGAAMLALLQEMAEPSKILVTARRPPDDAHFLFSHVVPELSREHALALIRSEAERLGFYALATASESTLDPLYEAVGGNPLALRVMVEGVRNFGLSRALDNLNHACGHAVERLYDYLYREAWTQLDDLARRVLLAMAGIGTRTTDLCAVAEALDEPHRAVQDALASLITLNLVDSEGDLDDRRYTIGRLTASFAAGQAHQW